MTRKVWSRLSRRRQYESEWIRAILQYIDPLALCMSITDEIHIERASMSDAEEILEVQKAAFLGQARIYDNYQLPPLIQAIESLKHEFTGKTFLKAVLHDQIIASVKFRQCGDEVHIGRLIVAPAYQNQGVGAYLMRHLEDLFQQGESFHLFTGEKSSRNIHLYTMLGYQQVKTEITSEGFALIHMEKGRETASG